jgi:hypothetical protein
MVTFESIVLEKAFQEDQARGGSGLLASAGSADCAAAAKEQEKRAIHNAERHPRNAFLIRQIILYPHLPVLVKKGPCVHCTAQTTQSGPDGISSKSRLANAGPFAPNHTAVVLEKAISPFPVPNKPNQQFSIRQTGSVMAKCSSAVPFGHHKSI